MFFLKEKENVELGFLALHSVTPLLIWWVQKVSQYGEKKSTNCSEKSFEIRGQKGTRKWVVEGMLSHFVFFLYKMGHSTVHSEQGSLQGEGPWLWMFALVICDSV